MTDPLAALREALDIIDSLNDCHGCLNNGPAEQQEAVDRLRAALAATPPAIDAEAVVVAMENEGVVTWGDPRHRARFLALIDRSEP